jgi:GGDEF domain-containing protein
VVAFGRGNPRPGVFTGFHGHCTDISQARRKAEETSHLASHDPLTGLANRRHMTQMLARTLTMLAAASRPCATLLIDLDRFKQVNDTLGHAAGISCSSRWPNGWSS